MYTRLLSPSYVLSVSVLTLTYAHVTINLDEFVRLEPQTGSTQLRVYDERSAFPRVGAVT